MEVTQYSSSLRGLLEGAGDKTVGFVPTMGALHRGHISLVKAARRKCDVVVASVFVNPTQFNDSRDLQTYPRMLDHDLNELEKAGTDIVFVPSAEEIYPEPDERVFDFGSIGKVMEGSSRPGHFNGVAQVVSRLFDIVRPDKAYFGEKDFQQVAVIKEMVRQLDYNIEIVSCPIIREEDGLAMSSRNMLLEPEYRKAAPLIYKTLREAVAMKEKESPEEIKSRVISTINKSPYLKVLYFSIVNADSLLEVTSWREGCPVQGCIAVQAGRVRLIDNIRFQ